MREETRQEFLRLSGQAPKDTVEDIQLVTGSSWLGHCGGYWFKTKPFYYQSWVMVLVGQAGGQAQQS